MRQWGDGLAPWIPVSSVPSVVFWLPGLFWQPVTQARELGSVLSVPRAAGKQSWAPQGPPRAGSHFDLTASSLGPSCLPEEVR